ncbi:hypothetical protein G7Y89_g15792 [Cudoniella acicularis]|uniref:Uncharacterized protein n=1 Tax=Cudoniella acicularis TaxID=354080 RepID=A0A8H4QFQ9_9HELO|nr:hypothetical protein G7Y89_g15792 [Cudoniella acicularis]
MGENGLARRQFGSHGARGVPQPSGHTEPSLLRESTANSFSGAVQGLQAPAAGHSVKSESPGELKLPAHSAIHQHPRPLCYCQEPLLSRLFLSPGVRDQDAAQDAQSEILRINCLRSCRTTTNHEPRTTNLTMPRCSLLLGGHGMTRGCTLRGQRAKGYRHAAPHQEPPGLQGQELHHVADTRQLILAKAGLGMLLNTSTSENPDTHTKTQRLSGW